LERELQTSRYDVVLPMELATQLLLTEHRRRVEPGARIPFADADRTFRVHDKGFLTAFAQDHGIECPATFFPRAGGRGGVIGRPSVSVLVKPRHSSGGRGIRRVERRGEFLEAYNTVHARFPAPIVQECLPPGGEALGVAVLMNFTSEPRASFAYRRLREYPATAGPARSARASATRPPGDGGAAAVAARWVGVAMAEFKVDPRDGRPKLLEVNPRFWGSLHHAIVCGVDFPWLLCRMAVEGDVDPGGRLPGRRTEPLAAARGPDAFPHAPGAVAHRPALCDFSIPDDVLSADDPWPTLGRMASLVALVRDPDLRALVRG